MSEFFLQIVLFLLGAVIGVVSQFLGPLYQRILAGLLAVLLLAVSSAWIGYEVGVSQPRTPTPPSIAINANPGTPTMTQTATPTYTRLATSTPTRVATSTPASTGVGTPALTILLKDDFNDGKLDASRWGVECDGGIIGEHDGKVYFHLPLNNTSPFHRCILGPQVDSSKVRRISLRVTLTNGTEELSWIGIYGSWDKTYLNLEVNPAWVGVTGDNQRRIRMETFSRLPITRTLSVEWTGNECRFTVVDSTMQQSIPCSGTAPYIWFGVYADPNAYVDGTIDDVEIWGVSS